MRLSETYEGFPVHRAWLWAAKGAGIGRVLNFVSFMGTALLPLRRVAEPDVIFVELPPITLFLTALAYRRRFPRALLVFNVADQWIEVMRDFGVITNRRILAGLARYARFCYARADLITAATHRHRRRSGPPAGCSGEKVLLLPNGADARRSRRRRRGRRAAARTRTTCSGRRLAVCIGTHGYIHGMETLLDAAACLTDLPDLVVLLVGDGSEKARLVELARARGLDNVRFADPIPPAAVLPLYRRAIVGLSTLRDLPIAAAARPVRAVNAMAAGVPLVYAGSRRGGRPGARRRRRHRHARRRRPGGRRRHPGAAGRSGHERGRWASGVGPTSSATSPGPPSSVASRTRSRTSWRCAMPPETGAAARCRTGTAGWKRRQVENRIKPRRSTRHSPLIGGDASRSTRPVSGRATFRFFGLRRH